MLIISVLHAQSDSVSVQKEKKYGLRIGYDIGKKIWSRYKGGNIDEFNLHFSYKNHIIGVIAGKEDMIYDSERYNFSTNGTYFKLEYAYNFYENWEGTENEITLGIRYGHASFDYVLHKFQRIPASTVLPAVYEYPEKTYSGLHAHWLEVVSSIRAEIFHGLYLELHVSGKYFIKGTQPENFGMVYVPGFYTTNISHFGFGLGYGISYHFGF